MLNSQSSVSVDLSTTLVYSDLYRSQLVLCDEVKFHEQMDYHSTELIKKQ